MSWCSRAVGRAALGVFGASVLLTSLAVPGAAAATPPVAGSAGTDTALPATDSAVTVSGRGHYAGLQITVNQTRNLVNQAVSVTWTGGVPTDTASGGFEGKFYDNYLQIMECWGNPDGLVPSNPGPPPQQCEFGGQPEMQPGIAPIETSNEPWEANSRAVTSAIAPGSPAPAWAAPDALGNYWMPFRSVDGTVINVSANLGAQPQTSSSGGNGQQFWLNPYFSLSTTNEDAYGITRVDGTGTELFTMDTGLEASGLGCGQQVQPLPKGKFTTPQCWLVIVPRSTPKDENLASDPGSGVNTSPLAPQAWANRIAIPLGFDPIGTVCPLAATATRINGSELAAPAVSNWQPTLCAKPGLPPFTYGALSDDQARQQLTSGQVGMAVTSRPVSPSTVSPAAPITYAPLTLSGAVVAFNVERQPATFGGNSEMPFAGVRVQHLNLTPRLVAKLLTESYQSQFLGITGFNLVYGANYPPFGYDWLRHNPLNLLQDPDFLQYNPEFKLLGGQAQGYDSGLVIEEPNSDAANLVWQWVLADPEARAWLAGHPDPWGMNVNPYYSTSGSVSPTGTAFGTPTPESYPKSDPYCIQSADNVIPGGIPARPLCMQDTFPYASSMQSAALETRTANDGAKTTFIGGINPNTAYGPNGPQVAGQQLVLSVTDSASAAQYGLQTAGLSAAGDDSANRGFVAPTTTGLDAGEAVMTPSSVSGVLAPNVSSPGAYPLTMLTYGALSAAALSASERQEYATFLEYAGGPGQTPGTAFGDLPAGYVPLLPGLRAQTLAAADALLAYKGPSAPTPTTAATTRPGQSAGNGSSGPGGAPGGASSSPSASSTSSSSPAGTRGAPAGGSTSPNVASLATRSAAANASAQPGTSKTPGVWAGAIRYALPIILAAGILCAFAARWWEVWRRRSRTPKVGPGESTVDSGQNVPSTPARSS
jgi:hypothetical protein